MAEPKTIMNGGPDRSVTDSPERIFEALFRVHDMRFEVCLPAMVRDYNRNSHLALVQPLVNMVSSEGEQLERSPILVPVRRVMYGEFMVDFPLNIGDTGWVIAGDRDSENALLANSGNVTSSSNPNEGGQRPATKLLHKYRFGFFIPDRWGTINLSTKDGDANYMEGQNVDGANVDYKDKAVIRSQNGKTRIVLSKDGDMEISLDSRLSITSPVDISGNVNISGNLTLDGSMDSTGSISTSGAIHSSDDISAEGKVVSDSDVVVNTGDEEGISMTLHTHSFPHTHETPSGQTTSQNPDSTQTPNPGAIEEREVTVNLTIKNSSSSMAITSIKYDRYKKTTTSPSTTSSLSDISASSSRSVSFKIKSQSGDSFITNEYFRIQFYLKRGSNWCYATNSTMASKSSATIQPASSTRTNGTYSGTTVYKFMYSFDFSQYLSGSLYGMRDIDITLEINPGTLSSSATTPSIASNISYDANSFVSEWSVSQ